MLNRKTVEWAGAISGLIGAALLAGHSQYSGYGFVCFLVSNLFWLRYSLTDRAWGLFVMQIGFTGTSILGITRWLL